MIRVSTPDGADLAVHVLRAGAGQRPAVLFAHANGFHGRCYQPVADELTRVSVALDLRGFGDSTPPPGWQVDWRGYGTDALAAAREFAGSLGPLLGVGHSMGGWALVQAALDEPALFAGLLLFEPIIVPPVEGRSPLPGNPLAEGARRRRPAFESYDAAIANFSSKPPLNAFRPDALEAYVRFGMREGDDGMVHLKCTPEHEARTFETGGDHSPFDRLGDLRVPTRYLAGRVEAFAPSGFTEMLVRATPGATLGQDDRLSHFGPMEDPSAFAAEIESFAATLPTP